MSHSKRAWRSSPCSWLALALVLLPFTTGAQEVNSSPSIVGSGARALGMGGAFIGVADDATAASWNPGGLTQLELPEVSLVYSWKFYSEDFSDGSRLHQPDVDSVDFAGINYFSLAYPLPGTILDRNVILSLNYQRKYDFDRKLRFSYRNMGPIFLQQGKVRYEGEGSLGALSPAIGFEVTDRLSLGAVMNIWNQDLIPSNEWEEVSHTTSWLRLAGMPILGTSVTTEKYENFEAINYTFGALYKATGRLSLGAVYHTAYSSSVDYSLKFNAPPAATYLKQERRIEWPGAIGVGAAYRFPNDRLTLSLDVTRRNWDAFTETEETGIARGAFGMPIFINRRKTSPFTGLETWRTQIDPTYTVRLGGEYVFFDPDKPMRKLLPSVRAGFIYDQQPAAQSSFLGALGGRTLYNRGDGSPDDFYGVTMGLGLLVNNRVNVDLAYMYRWGSGVRKDTFQMWDVDADVSQHEVYLSTVVYFGF